MAIWLVKIVGKNDFSYQFIQMIMLWKKIDYNIDILQQTACLGLTQSRLTALLTSLIARLWVGPDRLYEDTNLLLA